MNNLTNLSQIIEEIKKNPKNINNFNLESLTLDDWTAIFKTNEKVIDYLPLEIKSKKEVTAILLSHNHINKFKNFDMHIQRSKNFIILCMQKHVTFTKIKLEEINQKFPHDKDILKAAFTYHYLDGVYGKILTKEDILEYAKNAQSCVNSVGDFDLLRLPQRFKKSEKFLKQLCEIAPVCYTNILKLNQDFSKKFMKEVFKNLIHYKMLNITANEIDHTWNRLSPEKKKDKEWCKMFFDFTLAVIEENNKENKNNLFIYLKTFLKENKELLKDYPEVKPYLF